MATRSPWTGRARNCQSSRAGRLRTFVFLGERHENLAVPIAISEITDRPDFFDVWFERKKRIKSKRKRERTRLGIHDYGYPFVGFEDELFERGEKAPA